MILCATDLSSSARAATTLASWLARHFRDSIRLFHVIEPLPAGPEVMAMADWAERMKQAAASELEATAAELRKEGARVEVEVVVGDASGSILQRAEQSGARFITLGTHGRKGMARLFLGSVAERVSRGAPCPVIVTREAAALASRWPATRPLRLAVAADESASGAAALAWVGELRRTVPCEETVVSVYSPPREAARYGVDDPWHGRQGNPLLAAMVERDLRRALGNPEDRRIRLVAAQVDPAEELAGELALLQPDAVVIGTRGGRALWPELSVAAVLRTSPVPVICVPSSTVPAAPGPEIRSILVPVDLSALSLQALPVAYGLLRPHGGRVELCTVHERGPAIAGGELPLALPLDDHQRAQLEDRLRALIPASAAAAGVATRPAVLDSSRAPEAILQAAERFGVDLVVMASHGRSGIGRALLGSVAEEVARHSRVPVVIVHGRDGGGR
jgi:nucleotide-binding universal stress UspA family protein